jgi:hypothetical protein
LITTQEGSGYSWASLARLRGSSCPPSRASSLCEHSLGRQTREQIADAVRLDDHSVHLVGDTIIVAADVARPAEPVPNGKTR